MNSRDRTFASVVVLLLVLAAYGQYWTGRDRSRADADTQATGVAGSADAAPVLDESSLTTAQRLVRLPTTAEELPFAQEALHLADLEMDLAFAAAVRDAAAHPEPMTKEAQDIQKRLQAAQRDLTADSMLVTQLTAAARTGEMSTTTKDQLDLATAKLGLEQDEVDDARNDLIRAGGDPEGRLQALVKEHEAASANSDSMRIKVTAALDAGGLVQTAQALSVLRVKQRQIQDARVDAESTAVSLDAMHRKLDQQLRASSSASLIDTQRRALEAKARSSAEKRGDNQRLLAANYAKWVRELKTEERLLVSRGFRAIVIMLSIVLVWMFADLLVMRFLKAMHTERRSQQRLRIVVRVALQVFGVILILVVIFGTPNNLGTIIGLAGAGLTVALKDFIVSFVGWLLLMGKHGVRIGDLVEINGVTGEVVELGVFNTVLHETGNWTGAGHPTGRRVTFTNSYAVEGHYFNFSTSGQWLWDEVRISVPSGKDPYPVIEALQKHMEDATAESAKLAEKEWSHASRGPGSSTITAAPTINIKPVMGGVEVILRYITHAAERHSVRATLYRAAVEVLGQPGEDRP